MVTITLKPGQPVDTQDPEVQLQLPEGKYVIQLVVISKNQLKSEPVLRLVTVKPR